jgi:hypothetical protein
MKEAIRQVPKVDYHLYFEMYDLLVDNISIVTGQRHIRDAIHHFHVKLKTQFARMTLTSVSGEVVSDENCSSLWITSLQTLCWPTLGLMDFAIPGNTDPPVLRFHTSGRRVFQSLDH